MIAPRGAIARDKHCRFPGCTHDRWIDAHHVKHWADGGETSPANMILLCSAHHRLVHEEGFSIEKDIQGEWYFKRPDGQPIAHGSVYSEDVSAETLPGDTYKITDSPVSAETGRRDEVMSESINGRVEEPMAAYG